VRALYPVARNFSVLCDLEVNQVNPRRLLTLPGELKMFLATVSGRRHDGHRSRALGLTLACVLTIGLLPGQAAAALITFDFTASRNDGAILVGSMSYDTSAPDLNPGPDTGAYAGTSLTGTITGGAQDGGSFSLSDLTTQVFSDAVSSTLSQLFSPTFINLFGPGTALGGPGLPTEIDLSLFTGRTFYVANRDLIGQPYGTAGQLVYDLTSITRAQVPAPAAGGLMIIGLLSLFGAKRRRDFS
jgi:hypothetical protein